MVCVSVLPEVKDQRVCNRSARNKEAPTQDIFFPLLPDLSVSELVLPVSGPSPLSYSINGCV